jgi:hypothetical protein
MNSSNWDKFRKQQAAEREQLARLLGTMQPLLAKCREASPTEIELSALAAALHSFYTGAENIFKRLAVELDGTPVQGEAWHRDLLRRMTQPQAHRPALLSPDLHDTLLDYLRFRHVFRNAYSFDLDWQKLQPLVLHLEDTLRRLENALDAFVAAGARGRESAI